MTAGQYSQNTENTYTNYDCLVHLFNILEIFFHLLQRLLSSEALFWLPCFIGGVGVVLVFFNA